PDAPERRVHRLPLPALLLELLPAARRDAVVLAPPAAVRDLPARLDVAEALEPVQHRVQHPVGPLQPAPGELADALQDGVAVAVALRQDGKHQRRRRGRDEVLVDLHASSPGTYT